MVLKLVIGALIVIPSVIYTYFAEKRKWAAKTRGELIRMIEGEDWRLWKRGLQELRRRGEDISPFIPRFVRDMVHNSPLIREAARITLVDMFPEIKLKLSGYSSGGDESTRRSKVEELLAEYSGTPSGIRGTGSPS